MSTQQQITGRIASAQQPFIGDSFRKQTLIVEVVNNSYTSYFPIEFQQAEYDTLLPQLQMGMTYTFTGWLQGSKNIMQDKNQQPTAYLSFRCTAAVPAGSQLPAATSNINNAAPQNFNSNPPQQAFAGQQQMGGTVGQPQQQGFAGQQQNFNNNPAPQQNLGNQAAPSASVQNFSGQQQAGFANATPQQTTNQNFGNANGGRFGNQA